MLTSPLFRMAKFCLYATVISSHRKYKYIPWVWIVPTFSLAIANWEVTAHWISRRIVLNYSIEMLYVCLHKHTKWNPEEKAVTRGSITALCGCEKVMPPCPVYIFYRYKIAPVAIWQTIHRMLFFGPWLSCWLWWLSWCYFFHFCRPLSRIFHLLCCRENWPAITAEWPH